MRTVELPVPIFVLTGLDNPCAHPVANDVYDMANVQTQASDGMQPHGDILSEARAHSWAHRRALAEVTTVKTNSLQLIIS